MSRSLDAAISTALDSRYHTFFHLVTFDFATPFRMTDWNHDIEYDFGSGTETFLAAGDLVSLSNVSEERDINNGKLTIQLSGVDQANISTALTEDFNNKRVTVRRGLFDSSGSTAMVNLVGSPFIVWDGRVDSWGISEDPQSGKSTVSWNIESHWADWAKTAGRKCNNDDAQIYHATEEGFEYTYSQIGNKVWGRVRGDSSTEAAQNIIFASAASNVISQTKAKSS